MSNFDKNLDFFKKNLISFLEEGKKGKFVIIHNQKVIKFYDTFDDANDYAKEKFTNDYIVMEVVKPNERSINSLGFYGQFTK